MGQDHSLRNDEDNYFLASQQKANFGKPKKVKLHQNL